MRRDHDVQLVGVVDHRPGRASALQATLRIPRAAQAASAEEVPWLDEVDAVTIGTPPRSHHRVARAYLEAGKHVLLEKPMAMSVEEAHDLAQTARRAGRVLAVVHNFQFARSALAARRLIEGGELGELRGLWAMQLSNPLRRLPEWYEDLPLGLFYDESPHFLYLIRSLTATEPELVAAHVAHSREARRTPSHISLQLRSGDVPVQVDMNFEAPLSEWHLALLGSRRAAVIDIFRDVLVVLRNDGGHSASQIMRSSADGIRGHVAGVIRSGLRMAGGRLSYGNDEVLRRFVRACRTGESPTGLAAEDGIRVVELQHDVIARSRSGPGAR